jgi:hypothetical protein
VSVSGDILREAATIVEGARNQDHGDKRRSFVMIAALWSAYLEHPVSPADVAWMKAQMKSARAKCGTPLRDHAIDGSGYCAIAGELSGGE